MNNGIVIPCYNEAQRLKFNEFESFINNNPDYTICFVNDGSSDDTLNELREFEASQGARVMVRNLPENKGKAEAVRQGIQFMLSQTNVETVGFIDADLATGFNDYKRLVNRLDATNKDVVFGSRKMESEAEIERSRFRKLASWIIGTLIKIIVGLPIKDTQCGAKVFTRATALTVFNTSFQSRWLFDVEIFIRLKKHFQNNVLDKIEEVALLSWEEVEGSKITLKDSLKFPLQLIEIGIDYNVKPQLKSVNNQVRKLALGLRPRIKPAA